MSLNSKADIGEQFFEAIETICAGMINTLSFDRTIKCSIEDDSKKDSGEYIVTDGCTKFTAYSINGQIYNTNDVVLVQIPENNMENTKTIIGLTAIENFNSQHYVSPLDNIIILEEKNCINTDKLGNPIKPSLAANSPIGAFLIKSLSKDVLMSFKDYTRFGIKVNFNVDLKDIKSGDYLILISFVGDTENSKDQVINYQMTFDDFFGDPYSYIGIPSQEKVFDISIFNSISKCDIYLVQNKNFKDYSNKHIDIFYLLENEKTSHTALGLSHTAQEIFNYIKNNKTLNIESYNNDLKKIFGKEDYNINAQNRQKILNDFINAEYKNIRIEDFFIYLGYSADEYTETTPIIYTQNSLTFSKEENDDKSIQTRIIRIIDKETGDKKVYNTSDELITDINNKNWDVSIYQYKYNPTLEEEDPLAGSFWQPIGSYNDKTYETENGTQRIKLYDTKEEAEKSEQENVSNKAEKLEDSEKYIRIIQRYPHLKNKNNLSDTDILNYLLSVNPYLAEIEKTKVIICVNDKTHIQKTTSQAVQQENGSFEMQQVEEDYYELLTQFYTSNEILFNNSDIVESLEFNLVRNFNLISQEPYGGKFLIYDENDQILVGKEAIPSSGQKITAKFNLLSPGLSDTIHFRIRWKIPIENTMIIPEDTKRQKIIISIDNTSEEKYLVWKRAGDLENYYESDWIKITKENSQEIFSIESTFAYIFNSTYNPNYTNNTIICEVQRENGIVVSKSIDLIFGKSGNNGTSYTLIAKLGKKYIPTGCYKNETELFYVLDQKEEVDATFISLPATLENSYWIELKQELLDINKNKIELNLEDFKWEFKNNESNLSSDILEEEEIYIRIKERFSKENFTDLQTQYGKLYYQKAGPGITIDEKLYQTYSMEEINEENINNQSDIYYKANKYFLKFQFDANGNLIQKEHQYAILELSVEYSLKKLTSYLPIGFYNINNDLENDNTFVGYTGLSTITYDSDGANPHYYRNEHYLRRIDNKLKEELNWRIMYKNEEDWIINKNNNFYPTIIPDIALELNPSEAKTLFKEDEIINTYANSWKFYEKIENLDQFNEEKGKGNILYKLNLLKNNISYEDYIKEYFYRYVIAEEFTSTIETEEQFNNNSPLYKVSKIETNFWRNVYDEEEFEIEGLAFYNKKVETPKIQVPTILIENLLDTLIIIEAYYNSNSGDKIVWTQSVLIQKNAYGNQMLNEWDGNLTVDKENNKILSAVIGAGKKEDDNSFTGVLMGEIKEQRNDSTFTGKTIVDNSNGLFGYNKGNLSFGFRSDGSAFLGEAGKGRIIFNPDTNKAIIRSDNFNNNVNDLKDTSGSEWNLTDSSFKLYGDSVTEDTSAYSLSKLIINSKPDNDGEDFFGLYTTIKNKEEIELIPLLAYKKGLEKEQGDFFLQSEGYYLKNKQNTTIIKDLRNEMEDDFLFDGVMTSEGKPCLNLDFKNGEIIAEKGIIGGFGISSERLFSKIKLQDDNYNKVQISTYGIYDVDPGLTSTIDHNVSVYDDNINIKISAGQNYNLIGNINNLNSQVYFNIGQLITFKDKDDLLENSFSKNNKELKNDFCNSTNFILDDNSCLQFNSINLSTNMETSYSIYVRNFTLNEGEISINDGYDTVPLLNNCNLNNEQSNFNVNKTDDYICTIDLNIQLNLTVDVLLTKLQEKFPEISDINILLQLIQKGGLFCKASEDSQNLVFSGTVKSTIDITGKMVNKYGFSGIADTLGYKGLGRAFFLAMLQAIFIAASNEEKSYGFLRPAFQTGIFDSNDNAISSFEIQPSGIIDYKIGDTIFSIVTQSSKKGYINLTINKPQLDYDNPKSGIPSDYSHKIQHIEWIGKDNDNYILDYILSNQFLTLQTKNESDNNKILSEFKFDLLNNSFNVSTVNITSTLTVPAANITNDFKVPYIELGTSSVLDGSAQNYIDFHYSKSEADYTSRIIESESGVLSINKVKINSAEDGEIYYIGNNTIKLALSSSALYIADAINNGQIDLGVSAGKLQRRWRNIYCTGTIYFNEGYIKCESTSDQNIARFSNGSKILSLHNTSLYINDKNINLGNDNNRWNQAYLVKGTINGSDIRLKDVQDSIYLENLIKMYDSINPIAYKWKNNKETDKHNRIHVGLSSQEIEEKMLENNLTRLDFGGLCVDPIYDDNGNQIDESYSLRYGEFHGLHILKNHQQDEEIKQLKEKILILENKISKLESNSNS